MKMEDYMKALESEVMGKVDKLVEVGWEEYEKARKGSR